MEKKEEIKVYINRCNRELEDRNKKLKFNQSRLTEEKLSQIKQCKTENGRWLYITKVSENIKVIKQDIKTFTNLKNEWIAELNKLN